MADWLNAAHDTRSIGALYPEDEPYALMGDQVAPENFNALLFVEKTTAARKNPLPGQVQFVAVPGADGVTEYRDPEFDLGLKLPERMEDLAGDAFAGPCDFGAIEQPDGTVLYRPVVSYAS